MMASCHRRAACAEPAEPADLWRSLVLDEFTVNQEKILGPSGTCGAGGPLFYAARSGVKQSPENTLWPKMIQREIILQNIAEAREQLEAIEMSLLDPQYEECELRIDLEHAYHHLNYAWNIRNESMAALSRNSYDDFVKWSKFPAGEIQEYE
jgi:hypothetical protein